MTLKEKREEIIEAFYKIGWSFVGESKPQLGGHFLDFYKSNEPEIRVFIKEKK